MSVYTDAIPARRFDGSWHNAFPILLWIEETQPIDRSKPRWQDRNGGLLHINTDRGQITARSGDWILKRDDGECFIARPEVA